MAAIVSRYTAVNGRRSREHKCLMCDHGPHKNEKLLIENGLINRNEDVHVHIMYVHMYVQWNHNYTINCEY